MPCPEDRVHDYSLAEQSRPQCPIAVAVRYGIDMDQDWLDPIDLVRLRRLFARPCSRFLTIDGVDLHIVDRVRVAKGPAIILLSTQWLGVSHGDVWAPRLIGDHRVIRVDLPGHGLSGPFPDGDYSAGRYARLVAALVEALGLDAYAVIGTSFSGIAAAIHAASRPAGLVGLILATSSGLPRPPGGPSPNEAPADPSLSETCDGRRPRRFYDWKLSTLLRRPIGAERRAALVDEAHWTNELPGRAEEAQARVRAHDPNVMAAALPQIAVPLLVQWSSHSLYLTPDTAERIAALAPTTRAIHHYPNSGHLLIADAPEDCANDQAAFVATL